MNAKLTPLEFETIDEHWNVFLLSDGTKLKEKHVLLSIARRMLSMLLDVLCISRSCLRFLFR